MITSKYQTSWQRFYGRSGERRPFIFTNKKNKKKCEIFLEQEMILHISVEYVKFTHERAKI